MTLSREHARNLALLLVAGISIVLVVATANRPTTSELGERERNLIPVWNDDAVRTLAFTSGKTSFRVERPENAGAAHDSVAGDWALVTGEREPADPAAVDRLISGLGFAVPVRRLEGGELGALGLDAPAVTIDVVATRNGDSRKLRLALGKPAPAPEGAAYASVDGKLAVVPKDVAALFRTEPDDLRVHALVPFAKSDLRELVFDHGGSKVSLVRRGETFRVDGGERASRDALEPVFGGLARLDAKRFLAVADAEKARGTPLKLVLHLVPTGEKERPVVIELGGVCPGHDDEILAIVRSPRPRAACVERLLGAQIDVARDELFDKEPFSARADEVETLRIERGSKKLVLTRRGPAFLLREPSEATVELEAGNQRLAAMLRAPGELVRGADPKALGLDPPEGRVVITTIGEHDKAVEETLFLGKTLPDGTLPVRRADDGAVLSLGRDAARAFSVDATLLKSLKVFDFTLSELEELELSSPEHQVLRRTPKGLELEKPRGFEHDGSLATDAVLAFGSLTALRFVSDADDGSFGFEKPTLTARARYDSDGGTGEGRLLIGRPTPGGYFARREGDPSVFIVERSAVDRLMTLLIDRSPFVADTTSLVRVSITKNGATKTLERRNDELVPSAESGIDPAVATRLIEALEALRAEAALHTGAPRAEEGFGKPTLEVRLEPVAGRGKSRAFMVGASGPAANGADATHFARAQGIEATFLLADAKLKPLFELF